jgi:hypothetical protein
MKNILYTLLVVILLSGCDSSEYVKTEHRKYRVTHIDPPKRFWVTLEDVETGRVYKERISKRCSSWETVKVGTVVTLDVDYYKYGDKLIVRFDNRQLRDIFCPR